MSNEFSVEGRYFPNSLWAFTFASIQADRMDRPVSVHRNFGSLYEPTWESTAQPSDFVRRHLVRES